ncbi:MAG: DUF2071 domain-containing protein [Anaerolineae bacterium]|nr:DUF2071 domain-containing protein [Anaerolineae bacterium]
MTAHRPYPLVTGPWIMRQTWSDLAFLHWSLPVEQMRALVPASLPLDTFEGEAWLGIVPFKMEYVSLRGCPNVPKLSFFPELNVRTYVKVGGKPGVYFFSLDAGNPIAVSLARRWFRLPYYHADMATHRDGNTVYYDSRRTHRGAPPAAFKAHCHATSGVEIAAPGSLEHWLTERYCLYTTDPHGAVLRGEIHHQQWPLQTGEVDIEANTLVEPLGLTLSKQPRWCHVVHTIKMVAWNLRRV